MQQSKADSCMFRKVVGGEVALIAYVYVDDILLGVTAKDNGPFIYLRRNY